MATATRNRKTNRPAETGEPAERKTDHKGDVAKFGNLTRDPELRFSDNDTAYCKFGLAVERPKEPGNWAGERTVEFYEVTCFGSLAQHVAETLAKGARAVVIGKGEIEHWTGDDGKPRTTKRILADACGPDLRWATATVEKVRTSRPAEGGSGDDEDDDEPF